MSRYSVIEPNVLETPKHLITLAKQFKQDQIVKTNINCCVILRVEQTFRQVVINHSGKIHVHLITSISNPISMKNTANFMFNLCFTPISNISNGILWLSTHMNSSIYSNSIEWNCLTRPLLTNLHINAFFSLQLTVCAIKFDSNEGKRGKSNL